MKKDSTYLQKMKEQETLSAKRFLETKKNFSKFKFLSFVYYWHVYISVSLLKYVTELFNILSLNFFPQAFPSI